MWPNAELVRQTGFLWKTGQDTGEESWTTVCGPDWCCHTWGLSSVSVGIQQCVQPEPPSQVLPVVWVLITGPSLRVLTSVLSRRCSLNPYCLKLLHLPLVLFFITQLRDDPRVVRGKQRCTQLFRCSPSFVHIVLWPGSDLGPGALSSG